MTTLATSTDMIARYDSRTLGDLCSDDANRVSESGLATNVKMTKALESATGQLKAAVLRGERYTAAELTALAGDAKEFLVDVVCQLAFWNLWRRKPYTDDKQRLESKAASDELLESLRKGDAVFDIARQQDAGTPKVETVTRVDAQTNWDLFVDRARGRFYPRRRTYKQR